jgi:hypothetical protein
MGVFVINGLVMSPIKAAKFQTILAIHLIFGHVSRSSEKQIYGESL